MIATDDSKEEDEKFDSVRLVSEVFYLSSCIVSHSNMSRSEKFAVSLAGQEIISFVWEIQ